MLAGLMLLLLGAAEIARDDQSVHGSRAEIARCRNLV